MSLDLFNIYSEMILRNLENYPGVKINGENINNIRLRGKPTRLLDITIEKSEEMELTLNIKKTECM